MSSLKPITLYSHATGPNPWKVAIILEELGVPYASKMMDMGDLKKEPYEKKSINGRVPTIEDPNTDITLWESGAIIEYLVETYDKSGKFHYTSSPEKFLTQQWLHFQMSEQGPYFGQAAWFSKFHPERIASATERYKDQIKRVVDVLNRHLQGKEYLVGDKCTYADLAFLPWQGMIGYIFGDEALDTAKLYPNYHAWNARLTARPAVAKVFKDKTAAMSAGH